MGGKVDFNNVEINNQEFRLVNLSIDQKNNTLYRYTVADTSTTMTVGNDSLNESFELIPDIRQPIYMIMIYCIAYGIVFLFALFGNIIVIAVVYRNRRMHTLTNFFIVNLAVADILVAVFCVPITLLQSLYNGKLYLPLFGL